MQKIKKLSPQEARKIAAGEVIDRPLNVIKELIENSIDAKSNIITIYIEQAGKKKIQIIDNGEGMSFDDAQLCFQHHATSKINTIQDLNTLNTFGFRGEALSSIAAISKVKLITKDDFSEYGTCLNLENGEIILKEFCATSRGTDITIENIFYNIPARLKFLKKDETELRQIINLFYSFCLSNLNIHFKLFHENKLLYNCPIVENLNSRITQLWDHNLSQNMLDLSENDKNLELSVSGAISNHQLTRFNRSQIFFFVNGRWIKNQHLSKALLKGYLNVLPQDKFPAAFIFIKIMPNLIDVNIHPRKEEVEFLNAKKIENFIQTITKKNLEKNLTNSLQNKNISQQIDDQFSKYNIDEKFFNPKSEPITYNEKPSLKNENCNLFLAASQTTFDFEQSGLFEPIEINSDLEIKKEDRITETENIISQEQSFQQSEIYTKSIKNIQIDKEYEIIGQYKSCYILLEKNDGLFFIDQHAAHERILYELFSKRFKDLAKVKLIFPLIISYTQDNLNILLPYISILENYGIEVEPFSKDQLIFTSIPVHLKDVSLDLLVNQLIAWIEEFQNLDKDSLFKLLNDKLCAQMACKAAVKAGDKLNFEQMIQLLNDLQKTENRFACPHGRPTSWLLFNNEIEKKFKRKL